MARLKITKANRLIPNMLKLHVNGLEVDFDNCSFTHNSVILKIDNKIKARLFWVSENQELEFNKKLQEFKTTKKGFDIVVEEQDFGTKKVA